MTAVRARVPVLHICSDFSKQAVYSELVAALSRQGIDQTVYVPVRTVGELGANQERAGSGVAFRFAHVLRPHHRLFFRSKVDCVVRDLVAGVDIKAVGLVHAHFLYSDGAVALRLFREWGIPFIVAVRNTDVNYFMRWRPDLHAMCRRILDAASRVVFISPAYRDEVLRRVSPSVRAGLTNKAIVVPNGISDYWLDRRVPEARARNKDLRLLYVGDFARNKNIPGTIRAAALVRRHRDVALTLVGGGGDGEAEIQAMLRDHSLSFVERVGRITDRKQLADIVADHDVFVMPSFKETFGVVYLEALSQGLPVVFSRGQGIDGYLEDGGVGEAVDPRDEVSIADGICRLADRLSSVRGTCIEVAQRFRWAGVARTYVGIYREVSRKIAVV